MLFNDFFFLVAGYVLFFDYYVVSGDEFRNYSLSGVFLE